MIGFIFKLDPAPHPIGDKPLVQTEMILVVLALGSRPNSF
jgi:hypothetical protein